MVDCRDGYLMAAQEWNRKKNFYWKGVQTDIIIDIPVPELSSAKNASRVILDYVKLNNVSNAFNDDEPLIVLGGYTTAKVSIYI